MDSNVATLKDPIPNLRLHMDMEPREVAYGICGCLIINSAEQFNVKM